MSSAKQLNDDLKKGYWVVLFYAVWCGHCQAMKPEWDRFKSQSMNKKYNVAEVESSQMDELDLEHKSNVQGFPTIVFFDNGKAKALHNGERTVKGFDDFANNSLPERDNKNLNINKLLKKHFSKSKSKKSKSKKSKSKKKMLNMKKKSNKSSRK